MEDTGEQPQIRQEKNKADHLQPYQFKKGQSGNPAGRPRGKTLKEYAQDMLATMTEEERLEYLQGIDKKVIWEMAEGKAKQDLGITGELTSKIIAIDE